MGGRIGARHIRGQPVARINRKEARRFLEVCGGQSLSLARKMFERKFREDPQFVTSHILRQPPSTD